MGWTFYNASGQRLSTAATSIDVLDIDGATDIGAAIIDADLFIIDDNASGTNRKTTAGRLKTYIAAPTEAVKDDMEDDPPGDTNPNRYVSPEVAQFHPGVTKVWCHVERGTGTPSLDSPSYNVASVSDNGSGQTQITIATDFSSAIYSAGASATTISDAGHTAHVESLATATFAVEVRDSGTTLQDTADFCAWAFGDQ
jgi:hypothetical protein